MSIIVRRPAGNFARSQSVYQLRAPVTRLLHCKCEPMHFAAIAAKLANPNLAHPEAGRALEAPEIAPCLCATCERAASCSRPAGRPAIELAARTFRKQSAAKLSPAAHRWRSLMSRLVRWPIAGTAKLTWPARRVRG